MNGRAIKQICTISDPGPRRWGVVALAEDGTLWVKSIDAFDRSNKLESEWRQMEGLPLAQDDAAPASFEAEAEALGIKLHQEASYDRG